MFSWKRVRLVCLVLLLLPVAHLTYLVTSSTMASLDQSPDTWEREIEAYAAADAGAILPASPIVVVGGQGVRLWEDLEETLAPRPVLMRGLGDAIIEDISFNYSRLVGHYQPEILVLLPSHSEFFIRDNKSAAQLTEAIQTLAKVDAYLGITDHFYIFTPLKTPRRPQDHGTIEHTTQLLNAWAGDNPNITLLDANVLLDNEQFEPRAKFFRPDGVNLNEHGYVRLSMLLLSHLEANEQTAEIVELTP